MNTISTPLAIALAMGLLTAPVLAQTEADNPAVTVEDAIAIALAAQPGTIGEAELDQFEGKPAYDIEVIDAAGDEIEFKIDAATGAILNRWTDDDPTDDPVDGVDSDG